MQLPANCDTTRPEPSVFFQQRGLVSRTHCGNESAGSGFFAAPVFKRDLYRLPPAYNLSAAGPGAEEDARPRLRCRGRQQCKQWAGVQRSLRRATAGTCSKRDGRRLCVSCAGAPQTARCRMLPHTCSDCPSRCWNLPQRRSSGCCPL